MSRKYCPKFVTYLKKNEVFVFGSNSSGFHGGGSAAFAQRGTTETNWRKDKAFLKALKAPPLDESRKGKWSFLGQGRGYQVGTEGASYAIETIAHAGQLRSVRLSEILFQLKELANFARHHPEKTFFCVVVGGGYSGWSIKDFQDIHRTWCREDPPPDNILLKKEYDFRSDTKE